MRILMVNHDLDVKQYHLACALTDRYGVKCYFMTNYPKGLNWKDAIKQFPHMKNMLRTLIIRRSFFANVQYRENPFEEISEFSVRKIQEIDPDVIYFSSHSPIALSNLPSPIICDVEDSVLYQKDLVPFQKFVWRIAEECLLISDPKIKLVLFGSEAERNMAVKYYGQWIPSEKSFLVLYPFVAKRTLPRRLKKKTDEFSVVYLGSIWTSDDYRNYLPVIERIAKFTSVQVTVYMLNSYHFLVYRALSKLGSRYSNLTVKRFVPFDRAKEEISKFHVGLSGYVKPFLKLGATYGMKPFEYAYANVQPASVGYPRIKNLNDDREFGYCCTPETIEKDYEFMLNNFDREYHLMDNRLEEFYSYLKEVA